MLRQNNRRGFSLLELLVSATIIAVLTTIGVVSYSSVNKRSRDVKRKSDIEQIRSALEMFRSDRGHYPNIAGGDWQNASLLNTGDSLTGLVNTYMPAIPEDPSSPGNVYYYQAIQNGTVYNAYCICAKLETTPSTPNPCSVALPGQCNYGLKNP